VSKVESLTELLVPGTMSAGSEGDRPSGGAGGASKPVVGSGTGKKVLESAGATKIFTKKEDEKRSPGRVGGLFREAGLRVAELARPDGKWSRVRLGAAGGVIVLLVVIGYAVGRRAHRQLPPAAPPVEVRINTTPPDSTVAIDSKPIADRIVSLLPGVISAVEVSRMGYQSKKVSLTPAAEWNIVLEPEKLHLLVQTSEKSGAVELDGQKIGDLSDGSMDGEVTPDGNNHTLTVVAQKKQLFTIEFQAVPGDRPRLSALNANDLFVIATLEVNATVYGSNLKNVKLGDQNIASVTSSGVDLPPLTDQNHELKYGEGAEQGSVTIDIANVPELVVHAINTEGLIHVTANVENAILTVDGQPVRRQKRGWQISKPPGAYNFSISADGYEPQSWTTTMLRRQTFVKNVTLVPKVTQAPAASLVIAGGTAGSEVVLDGRKVGDLDENGNRQFPNLLAPGQHALVLQKNGYESRRFDFAAKPPSEFRVPDAKLTQWGTLVIQTATKNVSVKYRRAGESQWNGLSPNASTRLPLAPGQYEIEEEAVGSQPYKTEEKIDPGVTVLLTLPPLIPNWDCQFQDPTQVVHDGDWFKPKNSGNSVYLKAGCLSVNILFTKPKSGFLGKKKVQLVIETPDGQARVQYELEEQKITRKLITGEAATDQKDAKVSPISSTANIFSVHVRVDGAHVKMTNDKGEGLDDYTASGHDFSNGKIGIKTDSPFIVRRNN